MTLMSSSGSTLPPDRTVTTGPEPGTLPARTAASVTAPAGSTTALARSSRSSRAWLISSSVTVTRSCTKAWTCARVSGETVLTAMPSAMVLTRSSATQWPAWTDASMQAAPDGSTPTTRTPGRSAARAAAMPEMSPPPPTATTTVSASGASSASSSPMVPCPAMISGSSKGGTNTAPRSSPKRLAATMQSSTVSPPSCTVAP